MDYSSVDLCVLAVLVEESIPAAGPKSVRGNWPLWPPGVSRGIPPLQPKLKSQKRVTAAAKYTKYTKNKKYINKHSQNIQHIQNIKNVK